VRISQIFGPTIQGEGVGAGRHCLFLRVYNCNLHCSWCDTAYTWADTPAKAAMTLSGKQYNRDDPRLGMKEMTLDDVLGELHSLWDYMSMPTTLVISGGEPMMQQTELLEVGRAFRNWKNDVHIETAGTIHPEFNFDYVVSQYNVSPKLAHSGNRVEMRYKSHALRALMATGKAWFKFVVTEETTDDDFAEIASIAKQCQIPASRIQVMPVGTSNHTVAVARKVVNRALEAGYGLSLRTHILLWGDDPDK